MVSAKLIVSALVLDVITRALLEILNIGQFHVRKSCRYWRDGDEPVKYYIANYGYIKSLYSLVLSSGDYIPLDEGLHFKRVPQETIDLLTEDDRPTIEELVKHFTTVPGAFAFLLDYLTESKLFSHILFGCCGKFGIDFHVLVVALLAEDKDDILYSIISAPAALDILSRMVVEGFDDADLCRIIERFKGAAATSSRALHVNQCSYCRGQCRCTPWNAVTRVFGFHNRLWYVLMSRTFVSGVTDTIIYYVNKHLASINEIPDFKIAELVQKLGSIELEKVLKEIMDPKKWDAVDLILRPPKHRSFHNIQYEAYNSLKKWMGGDHCYIAEKYSIQSMFSYRAPYKVEDEYTSSHMKRYLQSLRRKEMAALLLAAEAKRS